MQIERDKVVTFHYSLTDAEGSFTEASEGKDPVVYLHGYGNIVPGLENELRGKQAGDTFKARIAPEHAYGMRDDTAVQRVPIKHLIRPGKLEIGKAVAVNTNAGPRRGLVLKIGKFNVDIDLNHPLAGKELHFDVKIVNLRAATGEEMAHGHVHAHGHHH